MLSGMFLTSPAFFLINPVCVCKASFDIQGSFCGGCFMYIFKAILSCACFIQSEWGIQFCTSTVALCPKNENTNEAGNKSFYCGWGDGDVRQLDPRWSISTNTTWIFMKSCNDIQGPRRMNTEDFHDPFLSTTRPISAGSVKHLVGFLE